MVEPRITSYNVCYTKLLRYSRSVAMVKAWVIAKAESLKTRVAGVTKLFRQEALQAIEKAIPANVGITLKHEQFNRYDSNAVAVYATRITSYNVCYTKLLRPVQLQPE